MPYITEGKHQVRVGYGGCQQSKMRFAQEALGEKGMTRGPYVAGTCLTRSRKQACGGSRLLWDKQGRSTVSCVCKGCIGLLGCPSQAIHSKAGAAGLRTAWTEWQHQQSAHLDDVDSRPLRIVVQDVQLLGSFSPHIVSGGDHDTLFDCAVKQKTSTKLPMRIVVQDVQLLGSSRLRDVCVATATHLMTAFSCQKPAPKPSSFLSKHDREHAEQQRQAKQGGKGPKKESGGAAGSGARNVARVRTMGRAPEPGRDAIWTASLGARKMARVRPMGRALGRIRTKKARAGGLAKGARRRAMGCSSELRQGVRFCEFGWSLGSPLGRGARIGYR
eukprot:1147937-Pelagomonas_calceolata.AAC.4